MTTPLNCMDCPNHRTMRDPDPDDSFNDDDMAVACTLMSNPRRDTTSRYRSSHSEFRLVTVSCRPYRLRHESERPDWCPLLTATV